MPLQEKKCVIYLCIYKTQSNRSFNLYIKYNIINYVACPIRTEIYHGLFVIKCHHGANDKLMDYLLDPKL